MTRSPRFPLQKCLALTLFALAVTLCSAKNLWEDTAFMPEVRSQVFSSLLTDNYTYHVSDPLVPEPGFNHPFRNWRSFALLSEDTFTPGERQRAFVQYAYQDSTTDYAAEANFFAGYDQRLDDPGSYGFLHKGLRVNSRLNSNINIRANWWNGRFYGDGNASQDSPLIDGVNNQNQGKALLDNLTGEVSFSSEHFTAALGRGRFQIGNTISGSVVLSDRCNDYDYVLLEQRFGVFRFSFLHGFLTADSTATSEADSPYPAKFIAFHQMSYQIRDWLELFIGETSIYGNKIDFSYLLPAYFWRTGKYNLRDRDNLMIFWGANVQANPDLTVYLNFALDELTYNKFYTNWWGNKYALQTGASLLLPKLALASSGVPRCTAEFTAIRPWTYTHYTNVSMYSHDARSLGYAKGANLLDLSLELNLPLPAKLQLDSQLSLTWQGSEGNDYRLNYLDYFSSGIMDTEADWLGGDVTFTCRLQNTLRIGFMPHIAFLVGHDSVFGTKARHQVYGGWQFLY